MNERIKKFSVNCAVVMAIKGSNTHTVAFDKYATKNRKNIPPFIWALTVLDLLKHMPSLPPTTIYSTYVRTHLYTASQKEATSRAEC